MSHTYTYENDSGELTGIRRFHFIHNSDMSGTVIINAVGKNDHLVKTIEIPGEALRDFIAEKVRSEMIERIEQMSTNELLRRKKR